MGFVNKNFEDVLTCTRASTATYVDPTGIIRTADVNVPRFTFDPETGEGKGLLVEEQRTNLLTWSEDFSNSVWVKEGLTVETTNEPSLIKDVYKDIAFVQNTGTAFPRLRQEVTLNAGTYTMHCAIEAVNVNVIGFAIDGSTRALVRVSDGETVSKGSAVTHISNNWKEIDGVWYGVWVFSASSTLTGVRLVFQDVLLGTDSLIGTGDVQGIKIHYAQLEQALTPSSYIPTEASAVTRVADNVSRTLGSEFNSSEGTFVYKTNLKPNNNNLVHLFNLSDTFRVFFTSDNRLQFIWGTGSAITVMADLTQLELVLVLTYNGVSAEAYIRVNGTLTTQSTATDSTISLATDIYIGNRPALDRPAQLNVSDLRYYPKALSEAECIELTKV